MADSPHAGSPRVLFVSVEMSPLAKVGGLADVAGSLPVALRRLGADVRLAMPFHAVIDRASLDASPAAELTVRTRDAADRATLWRASVKGVPLYLVENERFFGRERVYGYDDDVERWVFFCDALLASAEALDFAPEVLHLHDWHTAFVLTRLLDADHPWQACGTLFTIHNLGLPGPFDAGLARALGFPERALVVPEGADPGLAYTGMAQGILHADYVSTVSKTYAREILTPEYGFGFDPLLRARADRVTGIVNGIDYDEWNPATDPHIVNFDAATLDRRIENKRELQRRSGFAVRDETPLLGFVGRLFHQKGADIMLDAVSQRLEAGDDLQLVVLGTGDEALHERLRAVEARFPERVRAYIAFDVPLGQRIYGGCDLFLMPSRYEPCGLGQMIAQRYGAVPVVRRTGGLADTVEAFDPVAQTGTGFLFDEPTPQALAEALTKAFAAFADREAWRALQRRCMARDFSWGQAAGQYVDLYRQAMAARAAARAPTEA
ncbi:MAG TPA: glycogen/starch synthase [Dehalococcoidia bacterium]|nr:glycogen/starch synthase [Dehalococcoidia bacterium]